MTQPALNILFLCTHNSARSILAEATLNHLGRGRFRAYSAGSSPRENQRPNPLAIDVLNEAGIPTEGLRSKSWDEFAATGAPPVRSAGPPPASTAPSAGSELHDVKRAEVIFDLIVTVCDHAAGEVCPVWPGHPATVHWGYADPSEAAGGELEKREAFRQTLRAIRRRLERLVDLPDESLDRVALARYARALASRSDAQS
jgi:arsenate reductase (thioredoxin)